MKSERNKDLIHVIMKAVLGELECSLFKKTINNKVHVMGCIVNPQIHILKS